MNDTRSCVRLVAADDRKRVTMHPQHIAARTGRVQQRPRMLRHVDGASSNAASTAGTEAAATVTADARSVSGIRAGRSVNSRAKPCPIRYRHPLPADASGGATGGGNGPETRTSYAWNVTTSGDIDRCTHCPKSRRVNIALPRQGLHPAAVRPLGAQRATPSRPGDPTAVLHPPQLDTEREPPGPASGMRHAPPGTIGAGRVVVMSGSLLPDLSSQPLDCAREDRPRQSTVACPVHRR